MPSKPVTIEVAGFGAFPWDMLRYDQCAPADGEAADRLSRLAVTNIDPRNRERVTWENPIRLVCYQVGGPTMGRWNSFQWGVRVVK